MSDASIDHHIATKRSWSPRLDPARCALLVVDMQVGQVREDSAFHAFRSRLSPGLRDYFAARVAQVVEPNIVRLVTTRGDSNHWTASDRSSGSPRLCRHPPGGVSAAGCTAGSK